MARNKEIVGGIICLALLIGCGAIMLLKSTLKIAPEKTLQEQNLKKTYQEKKLVSATSVTLPKKEEIKRIDFYGEYTAESLPFVGIVDLADLSCSIKDFVKHVLENSNCIYLLKKIDNRVVIINDNPEDFRHGIEITEFSLDDGSFLRIPITEESLEEGKEYWNYDKKSGLKMPVKHVKYNASGKLIYTEKWNYSPDKDIKYEKKNSDEKIVSLKKESIVDNSLRIEHLSYDEEGNIKISISITYENSDLVRFMYYNSEKPQDSILLISEYSEGFKVKESLYSSDYKLLNTYSMTYKDGERENISVSDSQGEEVCKFLSK